MSEISEKSDFTEYLSPTEILDSGHEEIVGYAARVTRDAENDPISKAVSLYYAVRDGIWYDPYYPFYLPEHYRASNVLRSGRGFCISKAALLCALGRACDIPSRVGFATVRNHIATKQLIEFMGSDLFVYHGFTEFYLKGKWVKATPAFNAALCRRHKVDPLEFNGREDSIFHAYNSEQQKYMEYVSYHGSYADIPVSDILAAWEKVYSRDRVRKWMDDIEKYGGKLSRHFEKEEVL